MEFIRERCCNKTTHTNNWVQRGHTKCNKWCLKTLLHYISAPKQRISGTFTLQCGEQRTSHARYSNPWTSVKYQTFYFTLHLTGFTVNAHINLKQPSSKITQYYRPPPHANHSFNVVRDSELQSVLELGT